MEIVEKNDELPSIELISPGITSMAHSVEQTPKAVVVENTINEVPVKNPSRFQSTVTS